MAFSPQWLDELRSRITLSAVISRSTRLTKAGREFKACCPFHNEKSPSFTVNDAKGFYHCFGCGAHGDAIRWMTDQRGLSFVDAVKELAAEAGMEVPAPDPMAAQRSEKRETLFDVMNAAQNWFVANLNGPLGTEASAYLEKRGIAKQTISQFGFGYAPDSRQALSEALSRFPKEMLIEAGLRIAVEDREPYDRFRGRLMLPIEDARGRVIAFGGRILAGGKTDAPKYLNSPDTPLFDKGRTLYNLHRAAPLSRQSGRMIVVEGYMDVIALSQAGIGECVAPLGTALTETQIEMLWRHVETPILCFDGDAAGQRAAMRAVSRALPMLQPSHSLRFVDLPVSMDPDDIIRRAGIAGMELQIEEAYTLLDYLWKHERNAVPLSSPEDKAGLKSRIEDHLETISHPEIRRLYRRELFDEFFKFAYPRKDPVEAQRELQADTHPNVQRWRTIAKLGHEEYGQYMQGRLGAAIARGLILWPDQVAYLAEELALVGHLDRRIDAILDEIAVSPNFSGSNFLVAIAERGLKPPTPDEFGHLRLPFAWPSFEKELAVSVLKEAVALYAEFPRVLYHLKIATEDFGKDLNNDGWLDQTRLRERRDELISRLQNLERVYQPTA